MKTNNNQTERLKEVKHSSLVGVCVSDYLASLHSRHWHWNVVMSVWFGVCRVAMDDEAL